VADKQETHLTSVINSYTSPLKTVTMKVLLLLRVLITAFVVVRPSCRSEAVVLALVRVNLAEAPLLGCLCCCFCCCRRRDPLGMTDMVVVVAR
jgi:hypothetical protein